MLEFLTVEQVQQLIELATSPATNSATATEIAASMQDRIREWSEDQRCELYAL